MIQFILLAVFTLAFISPALPESAAQQPQPPWFVVFEEKGPPGDFAQFMRAQKEAVEVWKGHHPDNPIFAWQNEDNTLYRIIPIHSFASIDTLNRKMEQVTRTMKARHPNELGQPPNQSTVSGTVMVLVPELSNQLMDFNHHPDKPYTQWMFVYLLSGHEEAAKKALKNIRDFYIGKKLDYSWDTFWVLLGNDTPVMIGMFRAENPSSLQAKGDKIWKKHGAELEKLWDDVVQHTRKIEKKNGWFNQSLSNIPVIVPAPGETVKREQ